MIVLMARKHGTFVGQKNADSAGAATRHRFPSIPLNDGGSVGQTMLLINYTFLCDCVVFARPRACAHDVRVRGFSVFDA